METQTSYRLCLKLRVGKALATEEPSLAASLAGYDVTISSEKHLQPLSEASWLLIECRGFVTEEDARDYGEALSRAVHLAGLCTRVGVDGGDPGENRTVSYVNPDALRSIGVLDPDARIAPDIHGVVVLPDDGKTLFVRLGQAKGVLLSSANDFVRALEEAFPEPRAPIADRPSIRRAVRILNLAEMNADPIAKVVLAISTIEGLAPVPAWSESQKEMIANAAGWIEGTFGDGEATEQVVQAIQRIRQSSIRQRMRRLLDSNDLSDLWDDWERLYSKRSRLFHGGDRDRGEQRGDPLTDSELRTLAQEATKLCGRIVLSLAKREGIAIPGGASLHFGVE